MKKVIRLTESDLKQIVKRVLKEQITIPENPNKPNYDPSGGIGAARISSNLPATGFVGSDNKAEKVRQEQINKSKDYNKIVKQLYCVPPHFAPSIANLIVNGYNKTTLKIALGIIGRESSYASGLRYNITAPLKTIGNLLGYDTSTGPAQMSQQTAKDLKLQQGIDTISGALKAVYEYLKRSYGIATSIGYSDTTKSVNIPPNNSISAKIDISIASYNMGVGKIVKYCDKAGSKSKLKVKCDNKNTKQVKNYLPNYPTKRWDGVDISTPGYVAEVVQKYKKFTCF
jgi:hypothetical protein